MTIWPELTRSDTSHSNMRFKLKYTGSSEWTLSTDETPACQVWERQWRKHSWGFEPSDFHFCYSKHFTSPDLLMLCQGTKLGENMFKNSEGMRQTFSSYWNTVNLTFTLSNCVGCRFLTLSLTAGAVSETGLRWMSAILQHEKRKGHLSLIHISEPTRPP